MQHDDIVGGVSGHWCDCVGAYLIARTHWNGGGVAQFPISNAFLASLSGAKVVRCLCVLLLVLCSLTSAHADQRDIVQVKEYPWSTVARVRFGHGWCSAVLIGPNLVATAAHCLWNKITGRSMDVKALSVVVGWDRGMFIDGSKVLGVTVSPKWVPEEMVRYGSEQAGRDWALLELETPLGKEVGWVALSDSIKIGDPIAAVGYGEDRKHVAVAHQGCHITEHLPTGDWTHDCDAVHGDSGGPVFSWDGSAPKVIALTVARLGENRGGAVGVPEFIQEARKLGAPKDSRPAENIGAH